ncbi:hypothetical protein R0131_02430 [Clostridium sp. AL.422]|nr:MULTISPECIES: hypothetical protein [unclassified Clostridium]MDV4149683.1 hypothetical protein [Clostridium sp. AL.422]
MVISTIIMFSYSYNIQLSNDKIEEKARGLGMHYNDECKALFGEDDISD